MLDDLNILIVEDEAIIALDLSMILEERGATVMGPCGTVEEAVAAVDPSLHVAILDVDLRGQTVFPVADRLRQIGKPFVFHTGRYDTNALRARYGEDTPVLVKPAGDTAIVKALAQARAQAADDPR
ncbi:response regulator [Jannaschia sp. 2305UL9-9]|uniref:response regulator n=1 Tax=Jannaschia sp. 2305UL9-9 TaxID=3121638 RepID=UPI003526DA2D